MKNRFLPYGVLLVLLGYIGIGLPVQAQSPAAQSKSNNAVHVIVAIQGQLSIKRLGWKEYAPALFGTLVRSGDLLKLEGSSKATVACTDLTIYDVTGGISGIPCLISQPTLVYNRSLIRSTLGSEPGSYPMVISPRKTKLLDPRPVLRWTPVQGVTSYQLTVRGPGVQWSKDVAAKTEFVYPTDAQALRPGESYTLEVIAGDHSSREEGMPGLGFKLLSTAEAQVLREEEKKIRDLHLEDVPTRFLIAQLYATQGLNAEAIEQLEGSPEALKEVAVQRSLGDLYLKIGLNRLAEEHYLQALKLSQKAGDVEGQALAQHALGLIYDQALGNPEAAAPRLQDAVKWYQQLGDSRIVEEIQKQLAVIQ